MQQLDLLARGLRLGKSSLGLVDLVERLGAYALRLTDDVSEPPGHIDGGAGLGPVALGRDLGDAIEILVGQVGKPLAEIGEVEAAGNSGWASSAILLTGALPPGSNAHSAIRAGAG